MFIEVAIEDNDKIIRKVLINCKEIKLVGERCEGCEIVLVNDGTKAFKIEESFEQVIEKIRIAGGH